MWTQMYQVILCFIGQCLYVATSSHGAEADVRLTGDATKHGIGRVEIFHNNQWGSICDDYWDIDDANVVCRQLGYPSAVGVSKTKQNGSRGMPIWLDNLRCDGIESKLIDCAHNGWGEHNCDPDHSEDAFVECQVQGETGDVYLKSVHEHTKTDASGYLHIWYNNDWKKVCDPHWGITESHVVCRQLGLSGATYMHVPYGSRSDELITRVKCRGTEDRLDDCQHDAWHGNCQEGVFVACATNIPAMVGQNHNCKFGNLISPPGTHMVWDTWRPELNSSADALYHPEKYCEKQFTSDGYNQLTLDFFRNSTVCVNAIPSAFKCTKDGKDSSKFPGTVCDRRLGFTCNGNVDYCKGFNVSITCPCKEKPAWVSYLAHQMVKTVPEYRKIYPNLPAMCTYKNRQYVTGETRSDDKACSACTCVSRGGVHFWLCDDDDTFCPKKRPQPFESICYRENCDKPRVCNLGTWIVEWFIAGKSPFCEKCLYSMESLNDTYDGRAPETCPDCIPVDGVGRAVAVVNRKIPGPIAHVCEGDRVIVKVVNKMTKDTASGVTIHWHGMHMRGTPYMDGAFMVTQCPITIGNSFTYNFTAYPQGTHWWHSHAGDQRADGLFGGLIVRKSKDKDVNGHAYDFDKPEHTVIVQDWYNDVFVRNTMDLIYFKQLALKYNPSCILINGKEGQNSFKRAKRCGDRSGSGDEQECPVPRYAQFDVSPKKRYRFRMISSAVRTRCAFRIAVDKHMLTIIATDGNPIVPYDCKSFVMFAGERYDFVLDATYDSGDYWMRVEGLYSCFQMNESLAIIHYDHKPVQLPKTLNDSASGIKVDPCEKAHPGDDSVNHRYLGQLNVHPNVTSPTWPESDETYYIEQTFTDAHLLRFPQFSNVTFKLPNIPFLLQDTTMEKIETYSFENDKENGTRMLKQCGDGFCECTHVIHVALGKVVEIVIVNHNKTYDSTHFCHPTHLHGIHFRVVAEVSLPKGEHCSAEYVRMLSDQGKIKRKDVSKAILKDTMVAPKNGYTIIQFKADNPGYWYMHCHYELHVEQGMVLVLHVEGDLPKKPESFPECGNWPGPQDNDGSGFHWSESLLGGVKDLDFVGNNSFYNAMVTALENSKAPLEERFNRKFEKFVVTNNKLKTDPIDGFHYYLFKVNTGNGWYIHVQFKVATEYDESPQPYLTACLDGVTEEHPLLPIKVGSSINKCQPPVKGLHHQAYSKASDAFKVSAILFVASVLYTLVTLGPSVVV